MWRWDGDAFGATLASEDPDLDGNTVTVNLRFAGQYFDNETQLHYNYFRYYDPQTGRYITSDPIGLAGGLNTFGYVEGNPLNWFDPDGLIGRGRDTVGLALRNAILKGDVKEINMILQDVMKLSGKELSKKAQQCASKVGGELVKKHKKQGVGTGARSGQHGAPHKRAGADLIRKSNEIPQGSLRDALKREGNRLVNKGRGVNH